MTTSILTTGCANTVSEDSKDNDASNVISESIDKVAEVTAIRLEPTVFSHEIVSNGKVSAREKVDVNFQTPGIITAIYVKNGQRVAKGQRIATLDTYKIENQLRKDRNAVASARLEMQDVLIGQGYDPDHPEQVPDEVMRLARLRSGLEQAELTLALSQRALEEATLTTPVGGVVANLKLNAHNISGSEPLCRIIDDRGMDVEFNVIESELSLLSISDAVSVSAFSDPGKSTTGRITQINPMVDENGMVKVWASVEGGKDLLDGMNVRVRVKRKVDEALVVPKSAVVLRSGRQVVFTLKEDKAIWNYVATGLENLDQYTITEGLTAGDSVIIMGNINLAHEAPVVLRVKNEGLRVKGEE
ncbi:MAG: efflux RND transporter periplasmic adaptor subunit [Muribaculaceae bacterium]|nr:efflux RND transporter periplasmic adaptor subunit [Muribaculaceae bacterium]